MGKAHLADLIYRFLLGILIVSNLTFLQSMESLLMGSEDILYEMKNKHASVLTRQFSFIAYFEQLDWGVKEWSIASSSIGEPLVFFY
jgi:hypothetical protein